jgi:REP element-mobilizing transposase RayT
MSGPIRKSSRTRREYSNDSEHRFEHWYVDNQVYFITACCRDHFSAFASEEAKSVFWDRFKHWATRCGFTPWVTSLLSTHYHTVGYLREGHQLPVMMQRLHGSVAKQVNDLLGERRPQFWHDKGSKGREYYDGCLRDEKQCRKAFIYTRDQAVRAGLVRVWSDYRHTRINVELDRDVKRALELGAFMKGVRYPRYEGQKPARFSGRVPSTESQPP